MLFLVFSIFYLSNFPSVTLQSLLELHFQWTFYLFPIFALLFSTPVSFVSHYLAMTLYHMHRQDVSLQIIYNFFPTLISFPWDFSISFPRWHECQNCVHCILWTARLKLLHQLPRWRNICLKIPWLRWSRSRFNCSLKKMVKPRGRSWGRSINQNLKKLSSHRLGQRLTHSNREGNTRVCLL